MINATECVTALSMNNLSPEIISLYSLGTNNFKDGLEKPDYKAKSEASLFKATASSEHARKE